MLHKLAGHYQSEVMLYIIDRIIEVSISAAIIKYIVFGGSPMNKVCINGRIIKETALKELENNNDQPTMRIERTTC
jgi:hypothetical protein